MARLKHPLKGNRYAGTPPCLDPAEIARTLDEIEQIGNRYHGTPGEARCRDYLGERFEEIGLEQVHLEPFRYLAYEPQQASCSILNPKRSELACRALQFSANGEAEGEAIYLGAGTATDLLRLDELGANLTEKIVVVHSRYPFLVTPLLEGRGVGGLIVVCDAPDGLIANHTAVLYPPPLEAPWPGRPLLYPAVTIEASAGRDVISTMTADRPVVLRVTHHASYLEKEANNVIGHVTGSTEERVLVGGHYDSQAEGPCIWDNGAGLASMLEIARAHAASPAHRTVVIVAFAVEEVGLWGSTVYVTANQDQMSEIAGMINLDAVATRFPGRRTLYANETMRPLAVETATRLNWEPDVVLDACQYPTSDHAPFCYADTPCCFVLESPLATPYYHTSGDVRALVDEVRVAETAGISAAIAWRLATEPDLARV